MCMHTYIGARYKCVAVCCSVLQCVAVCCSVRCSVLQCADTCIGARGTGWQKRIRYLIYIGYFLQNSQIIIDSAAERELKKIVCIFATLY